MPIPIRANKRRPESALAPVRQEVASLFAEAERFARDGKAELAQRRVRKARRVAMKVQLRLTQFADRFCRSCDAYLIQGENMTIRIKDGMRIRRCRSCGAVRRKLLVDR